MRVLHLLGLDRDEGGVLSVLRNLQEASAGTDIEHVAWVHDTFDQVRTPTLELRRSRTARPEGPIRPGLALSAPRGARAVCRLLDREPFDVVHAHTRSTLPVAALVSRQRRMPVGFTNHNYGNHPALYRMAARLPGMHTVLLSEGMADHYGIAVEPPRVRLIPPSCSDRFFDVPIRRVRRHFSPDQPLRLTGLGMMVEWKGWRTACEAIARLRPDERAALRFTHRGTTTDPGLRADLDAFVDAHDLQGSVSFEPPTDQVTELLAGTDWLLHPAIDDPYPVAVLEALAVGVPVLATRSGGPAEMVSDGRTGLHVDPGDPEALAERLRAVLDGHVVLSRPEAIRDAVRVCSASAVLARYVQLWELLARGADGEAEDGAAA